jgi:hypothetical protein
MGVVIGICKKYLGVGNGSKPLVLCTREFPTVFKKWSALCSCGRLAALYEFPVPNSRRHTATFLLMSYVLSAHYSTSVLVCPTVPT